MTSARRVMMNPVAAPVIGKNVAAQFSTVNNNGNGQMPNDGVNFLISNWPGHVRTMDKNVDFVQQRLLNNTDGNDYGNWGAVSTSTFDVGTNYLVGRTYVGSSKSVIAQCDNTLSLVSHKRYGGAFVGLRNQIRLHNGDLYAFYTQGTQYVIIKYDQSLTQIARYDDDITHNRTYGFSVDASGVYVITSAYSFNFTIGRLDLNLNPVSRVRVAITTNNPFHPANVFIHNGFVYAGVVSRNAVSSQYDAAVFKVSTDLSTYEAVRCEANTATANDSDPTGVHLTDSNTIIWVGMAYRGTGYRVCVYEFDTDLNVINQFEDVNGNLSTNANGSLSACAINNSLFVNGLSSSTHHIVRLDDRSYPIKTEASCDNFFGWENTSHTFTKSGSQSTTAETIGTGSIDFVEETSNMTDSALSDTLSAQCEFTPA